MTTEEFSNEFDTLINSYATSESFGNSQNPLNFDEYEKSVFLTKAQEELVIHYYTGKATGDSFEDTEQMRRYLSELVKTDELVTKIDAKGISDNSVFFKLPNDVWFITYESVTLEDESKCLNGKNIQVVPVTQDEYHKIKDNPFRQANSRRALRLDNENNLVEIISPYNIAKYIVRYVAKPTPIILVDLPDELSINNENKITECKLNPVTHRTILEVAVKLAISSRSSSTGK